MVSADYREGGIVNLHRKTTKLPSEVMQNAFGAKAAVSKEAILVYSLKLQNKVPKNSVLWTSPDVSSANTPMYMLGLPLLLAPSVAQQQVRSHAYTVLLGVRVGDLRQARDFHGGLDATFDSPEALGIHGYTVPVDLEHVQIMSLPTHKIVASWSTTSGYGLASVPSQ